MLLSESSARRVAVVLVCHSVCFGVAPRGASAPGAAHLHSDHGQADEGLAGNARLRIGIRVIQAQGRKMDLPEVGNVDHVTKRTAGIGTLCLVDQ